MLSMILRCKAYCQIIYSRQGPCIEVADVNKDGLEDFFMGGAKGVPSQIFIQNRNGKIQREGICIDINIEF